MNQIPKPKPKRTYVRARVHPVGRTRIDKKLEKEAARLQQIHLSDWVAQTIFCELKQIERQETCTLCFKACPPKFGEAQEEKKEKELGEQQDPYWIIMTFPHFTIRDPHGSYVEKDEPELDLRLCVELCQEYIDYLKKLLKKCS